MSKVGDPVNISDEHLKEAMDKVIVQLGIKNYTKQVTLACGKGDNYFGTIYRVNIEKKDKKEENLRLILKFPQTDPIARETLPVTKLFNREVFVYNVMLPELCLLQDNPRMPDDEKFNYLKCYQADAEYMKEYLILEDACASGFKTSDRKKLMPFKQIQMVLKRMAQLHSLSFVMRKRNPEMFKEFVNRSGGIYEFSADGFRPTLALYVKKTIDSLKDTSLKKKLIDFAKDDLYDKILFLGKAGTVDEFAALCHGDCWSSNVLFKTKDGEPVDCFFLDWQTVTHASPFLDISYFIFSATDEEFRRKHFKTLMEFYYESLGTCVKYMGCSIDELYPVEKFYIHMKKILPFGFLMAFVLMPAVVGEVEDAFDTIMDKIIANGAENVTLDFTSQVVEDRFIERMEGIMRTLVDLEIM